MTTVLRPALVWKEVRGLGPTWLTAAALLVAVGFVETGFNTVLLYVGACALLGALSIGQEFTDRTLAGLLAQPAARSSVLLRKLGVVAAMLLALGGLQWAYGLTPLAVARAWPEISPTGRVLVIVLPVLGGVLLTPCLTLLTRSALAGCVFTIALSLAMVIGSQAAVPWLYGDAATLAQANARFLDIFAHTMLAVVVLSALLLWRLFMRLEAIEGRRLDLHLPAWSFKPRVHLATARSARSVWQQMLGKELHLQQMTFVVSGLYVAAWLAVVLVGESLFSTRRDGYMTVATLLHAGAIPLLAGSLASAEERQLGTLDWQVLLPIAAWRQWAVKAAVVLLLSLGLAIGVPAILYALFASGPVPVRHGWPLAAALAAVATLSLYASSLSTSGVRALLASLPAAFVAARMLDVWVALAWDLPNAARAVVYAASAAVFAWLLWLGMKNHGSAERGAKRVLKQVAALGAVAVVAMLAFAAAASR